MTNRDQSHSSVVLQHPQVRYLLVALTYLVTSAFLGSVTHYFSATIGGIEVGLWFPMAGVDLVLLWYFGGSFTPVVWLSAIIRELFLRQTAIDPFSIIALTFLTTIGYLAVALLLRRVLGANPNLSTLRSLAWFVTVSFMTPLLTAVPILTLLAVFEIILWPEYLPALVGWWLGDVVGLVTMGPLCLVLLFPLGQQAVTHIYTAYHQPDYHLFSDRRWPERERILELAAQTASIILIIWLVFFLRIEASFSLLYLHFLPLIWIALRHGFIGAIIGVVTLNVGIVLGAAAVTDFILPVAELQLFSLSLALTGLVLGAAVTQYRDAAEQLRFQAQLLDSVRESVVATDLAGQIIYWGKGAEELYGYTGDEVLGQAVTFIEPEAGFPDEEDRKAQVLRDGYWAGQYRQRRKNGRLFWGDTVISLVRDETGQPSAMIGIDRDITDRRQAEHEARQRNLQLAALNAVAIAINATPDLNSVLQSALEQIVILADVDGAESHLLQASGEFRFATQFGLDADFVAASQKRAISRDEGIQAEVAHSYAPVYVPDIDNDHRYLRRDLALATGYRTLICVPIVERDNLLGTFIVYSKKRRQFALETRSLLMTIGQQLAVAIERSQLFTALQESETRYRAVAEITADYAYALRWQADQKLVREWLTGDFQQITGYAAAVFDDYDQWIEAVHPSDREHYERREQNLLQGQPQVTEYRVIKPDGQVIWLQDYGLPILNEAQKQVVYIYGGAREITEQKQAMEAAQRFAQQLEAVRQVGLELTTQLELSTLLYSIASRALDLLGAESGGIYLYRADEDVLEWSVAIGSHLSPTGIKLRRGEGLSGQVWERGEPLIINDYLAWTGQLGYYEESRSMAVVAVPVQWGDEFLGVIDVISEGARQFSEEDAQLLGMFANQAAIAIQNARLYEQLRDYAADLAQRVDERTRELATANEQLQELDRLKTKFVSDVSHELRTPVTNLSLYLDLLTRGRPERRADYMQILHSQIDRLKLLIEDILDLSRLDLRKDEWVFTAVDLNQLTRQAVSSLQKRATDKRLALQFDPAEQLPAIQGEPQRLEQVIRNLLMNAINYTEEGHIQIKTWLAHDAERQSDCLYLAVSDTGIGLDEEDQPHLFDRFYRGQRISQLSLPGTGLGLAIAQEIVHFHGGEIRVESELNVGSTFTVVLPLDGEGNRE